MTNRPSRQTRALASQLAAQVCQGQAPSGSVLLGYIIVFESYLERGGDKAAEFMGWDVVPRKPVKLSEVRDKLKDVLT